MYALFNSNISKSLNSRNKGILISIPYQGYPTNSLCVAEFRICNATQDISINFTISAENTATFKFHNLRLY